VGWLRESGLNFLAQQPPNAARNNGGAETDGAGSGCDSYGCGYVGGADFVVELNPFWKNVWQNSFS
jgi:hypothetical protein